MNQIDGFYQQPAAWREAERLQREGFATRVFWNAERGSWSVAFMTIEEWKNNEIYLTEEP